MSGKTPAPNVFGWLVLGGIGAWLFTALRAKGASAPSPAKPPAPPAHNVVWLPVQRHGAVDPGVLAEWVLGSGRPAEFPLMTDPPQYYDVDRNVWVFFAGGALWDWRATTVPQLKVNE